MNKAEYIFTKLAGPIYDMPDVVKRNEKWIDEVSTPDFIRREQAWSDRILKEKEMHTKVRNEMHDVLRNDIEKIVAEQEASRKKVLNEIKELAKSKKPSGLKRGLGLGLVLGGLGTAAVIDLNADDSKIKKIF